MASYLRPRRGKKSTAEAQNILLKKGEIFFEVPDNGIGKGKLKMGDGITPYKDLPYFLDNSGSDLIDTDDLVSVTDESTPVEEAKLNADLLDGHDSNYYAKQNDIDVQDIFREGILAWHVRKFKDGTCEAFIRIMMDELDINNPYGSLYMSQQLSINIPETFKNVYFVNANTSIISPGLPSICLESASSTLIKYYIVNPISCTDFEVNICFHIYGSWK